MRQALRKNGARAAVDRPVAIPSPIKGWMPSTPLPELPPEGAVLSDNWWPDTNCMRPRGGSREYVTSLSGTVETLMTYRSGDVSKLFAAAGPVISDVSDPTSITSGIVGLRSARFQWLNFATAGGPSLIALNGVDLPCRYNGSAWSQLAFTFLEPTTAVDPSLFAAVTEYNRRLFFAAQGSTTLYYLPAATFQGELSTLDVGTTWPQGGYVAAIGNWTHDSGQGLDDYFVVVSSEGDVTVYAGTNPSDASNWSRVGTYQIARPIGRRCLERIGGDLLILTVDGIQPMSRILTQDRAVLKKGSLTANIRNAIQDATARYGNQIGWGLYTDRDRAWFLVNVAKGGPLAEQFAMNIGTGAWTRFTGWNATCFAPYNGRLFYGAANGRVIEVDTGFGDCGAPTFYPLVGGFTELGNVGRQKQAQMMRALITANVDISVSLGVCVDYVIALPGSNTAAEDQGAARWDYARWDIGRWASSRFGSPHQDWALAEGIGEAFAPAIAMTLDANTSDTADIRLIEFKLLASGGGLM